MRSRRSRALLLKVDAVVITNTHLPEITVLMPMRNAEPFVRASVDSVLSERRVALELIVVDDGSSDRSGELVRAVADPRVRLIDGPRLGVASALNAGLAVSRADIVMRCDADDLYAAGRISAQRNWLAAHPRHGAVCGSYTSIDDRGRIVSHMVERGAADAEISDELCRGITRTSLCTFAMRRSAIERIGGFRPYFETSSDIDFQLRLGEVVAVHWRPANTYFYRLHDGSITHSQVSARREFFEHTARRFALQRRSQGQDDLQRAEPPAPPAATAGKASTAASQVQGMLVGQAWRHWEAGARRDGLRSVARAIRVRPTRWAPWRALLAMAWLAVRAGGAGRADSSTR